MSISTKDITEFLVGNFSLDRSLVDAELPLFSSALLDSSDMIGLILFLEEKTGLTIDGADLLLENFDTIGSILAFCESQAANSLEG
jgi:acyl carrier protein